MHARLEALEARPALVVEHHDLAVEHHTARPQRARELSHLRIARREVASVPAAQLAVAMVAEHDRPDPVPLHLEAVLLLARRQLAAPSQHGLKPSGMGSYAGSSGGSIRWIIQFFSRVLNSA